MRKLIRRIRKALGRSQELTQSEDWKLSAAIDKDLRGVGNWGQHQQWDYVPKKTRRPS